MLGQASILSTNSRKKLRAELT